MTCCRCRCASSSALRGAAHDGAISRLSPPDVGLGRRPVAGCRVDHRDFLFGCAALSCHADRVRSGGLQSRDLDDDTGTAFLRQPGGRRDQLSQSPLHPVAVDLRPDLRGLGRPARAVDRADGDPGVGRAAAIWVCAGAHRRPVGVGGGRGVSGLAASGLCRVRRFPRDRARVAAADRGGRGAARPARRAPR